MSKLVSGGMVQALRGKNGGFRLIKKLSKISLLEIIETVEGPISLVDCVDDPSCCKQNSFCVTNSIWREARDGIVKVLKKYTLKDMVDLYHKKRGSKKGDMYYI